MMPESLSRKQIKVLSLASYTLIFIILLASYTVSAFPQGDDAIVLLGYSNNAFPWPGSFVANRVVGSFLGPFFFLIFQPVDYFFRGQPFFESFARFTGLINAGTACSTIAIAHYLSQSALKVTIGTFFSTLACSTSLVLGLMFGDVTHGFYYSIPLAICLFFLSAIRPLDFLFAESYSKPFSMESLSLCNVLLIAGYFTAFGHELFALFSWVYVVGAFSILWVQHFAHQPVFKPQFRNATMAALDSFRYKSALLIYAPLSIFALWVLSTAGRARNQSKASLLDLSEVKLYSMEFVQGFLDNSLSRGFALSFAIVAGFCLFKCLAGIRSKGNMSTHVRFRSILISISPLLFYVFINLGYFAVLYIAGYKASRVFVASPELPGFYADRSYLFLAPLLVVNLALALRCLNIASAKCKQVNSMFVLLSMFILLSKGNTFFAIARERQAMSSQLASAFDKASKSTKNTINVPFCLPSSVKGVAGYPVLPSVDSADWYRKSYADIFRLYYSRDFGSAGPVFKLSANSDDLGASPDVTDRFIATLGVKNGCHP